ncbi:AraC family transcriptional regulator [Streptomyces sp. NPDC001941]|uniref:helix-turn-helix transcriptional regulator n=1 Tax=Streptomyces sp. NPDC001941 TaxID=3154659 RepID=UPI0033343AF2
MNTPHDRFPFVHVYGRIALLGAGQDNHCLAHLASGPVTVDHVVRAHARTAGPLPFHALCLRFAAPERTPDQARIRRAVRRLRPAGDLALVCHRDLPHYHDPECAPGEPGLETLLDATVVDTTVAGAGPPTGRLDVVEHLPVAPEAAARLEATVGCLRTVLALGPQDGAGSPALLDSFARLLAASLLGCMPRPHGPAVPDAYPATLRRAVDYIHAHAHQPVALSDITTAAQVTARALQYAFAQIRTTPLAYLRDVRLARAHDDLRDARPGSATVTDVASRWGFAHPGRFAAYYRSAYGTNPSATLNRPPPPV